MSSEPPWTFFRAGGFDQVRLDTGADLLNIDRLDQKLWVALACPIDGLEIDRRTLELIDSDKDGRVRVPELIAGVRFAGRLLKNPDDLLLAKHALPLAALRSDTVEGATILSAARRILANLGRGDIAEIAVEDLADPERIFADGAFNGDGIIREESAPDDACRQVIADIMACVGSIADRSGKPGIATEQIDLFFGELRRYIDWRKRGEDSTLVFPLGRENTEAAVAAVAAIREKVDDYFTRCRLAAFEPRIAQLLNRKEEEYLEIAARDLSLSAAEISGFPLAQIGAGRPLPLLGSVNPAHTEALKRLRDAAVNAIVGPRELLADQEWTQILTTLAPHFEWKNNKEGALVEKLGAERASFILNSALEEQLRELVAKDRALEDEVKRVEDVERIVRYYRDLYLICTNFVNFKDFYDGQQPAIFQCGTLYLDQRECRLCLRVKDPASHAAMAGLAGAYLVYAECSRPACGEKMNIVAVVTAGESDNLMVGRNGLFYDRQGRDWDASITKIVESPISIRQAFWAPYKKAARFIESQVAKRAAASDSDSQGSLVAVAQVDKDAPVAAKKIDVGSVAALGVAVGAIGTFFTAMVGYFTGLLQLGIFATVGAILGVVLLISLPSVVLASLALRKRNLGPILDANGWAVNAKARVNVSFGATLTSVAKLPPGARRDRRDRFVDRGPPWKRIALAIVLLIIAYRWLNGSMNQVVPFKWQAKAVFGRLLQSGSSSVKPNENAK